MKQVKTHYKHDQDLIKIISINFTYCFSRSKLNHCRPWQESDSLVGAVDTSLTTSELWLKSSKQREEECSLRGARNINLGAPALASILNHG